LWRYPDPIATLDYSGIDARADRFVCQNKVIELTNKTDRWQGVVG